MENAEIHYLNWDQDTDTRGPETEIFHKLNTGQDVDLDQIASSFDDLYREVCTTHRQYTLEIDDLEQLYQDFQHTPGYTDPSLFAEEERSMSCGDTAHFPRSEELYMVDTVGWTQLDY